MGDNNYVFSGEYNRPIINKKFLKKVNDVSLNIDDIDLTSDKKIFNNIVKSDKELFKSNYKNTKRKINEEVARNRKMVRNQFYYRWYATLFATVMSLIMIVILKHYYDIVRRKSLTKKTTHDIYFATNTTSKVFRWIAQLIVALGIFTLVINLLFIIFTARPGIDIPFYVFAGFSFIYAGLMPIVVVVTTVIASWIFVLESELICFISNCYDVVFKKAYTDTKVIKD